MPPPRKDNFVAIVLDKFYKTWTSDRGFGFTLAEVLITLGIIGVVAALTISRLVTNYQKHVTVTRLKVAYQLFSEAIEHAKSDFGYPIEIPADIVLSYAGFSSKADPILEHFINPYLTGVEKYKGKSIKIWNTSKTRDFAVGHYMHMYCIPQKEICYDIYNHGTNYRYLFVDINGPKEPNVMGRDGFLFDLSPAQKAPTYVITGLGLVVSPDAICTKDSASVWNGTGCAAKIILNSWKIPDDYPW